MRTELLFDELRGAVIDLPVGRSPSASKAAVIEMLDRIEAVYDRSQALDSERMAWAIHRSNEHPNVPGCLDMDRDTATSLIAEYAALTGPGVRVRP